MMTRFAQIRRRVAATFIFLAAVSCAGQGRAQQSPMEEVIVIGVTPVHGSELPVTQIPYNVQSAHGDDIERVQSLSLADFLNRTMESISINDVQNNPLQPDVQYRGFTASPLLGLAQGIAVYQNGVRINEPLGDAVNWDLLPQSAIYSINLIGGSNPLFGLNTLGGALTVDMKDGFNTEGHVVQAQGGSFGRRNLSVESGGNGGPFAYYANLHLFDEDGWRDLSGSSALNFYSSLGWRDGASSLNFNAGYGDSELIGNGPAPVELLDVDRDAIFTAPDITDNGMHMFSLDGFHSFTDDIALGGNIFYRRNKTHSFNGDASEFVVCNLGGQETLLEGIEDDDLEELSLEEDDICDGTIADADALEDFLNATAAALGEGADFNVEDLSDELSGTGLLSGEAINNTSDRRQKSYGADLQLTYSPDLFDRPNQFIVGFAWYRGDTDFDSQLELAGLDPDTRSTEGLGTGTFVDDQAARIRTRTESLGVFFTDTVGLTDRLSLTVSGRFNVTGVDLEDRSGARPELNGEHDFNRFNPAVGLTYEMGKAFNIYGGYSESSRAPTPIELACNEHIFALAEARAGAAGEDPEDVEFECRLPNAFLADPPLDQVVTESFEVGARGTARGVKYHIGLFHTISNDDIVFQTTGRNTGLFANVDKTRRRGFESGFNGNLGPLDWYLAYSFVEATFQDEFAVLSPNHPFADEEDGTLQVDKGDHIPGIPEHQVKIGGDWIFSDAMSAGLEAIYNSDQTLRGDESNLLDTVDGYAIVNLRGRYRLNNSFEVFAQVTNLFDTRFETFGLVGEDPSGADIPAFAGFSDPRFLGPGSPRAGFIGLKLSL